MLKFPFDLILKGTPEFTIFTTLVSIMLVNIIMLCSNSALRHAVYFDCAKGLYETEISCRQPL